MGASRLETKHTLEIPPNLRWMIRRAIEEIRKAATRIER
jgi:hypothetical protein